MNPLLQLSPAPQRSGRPLDSERLRLGPAGASTFLLPTLRKLILAASLASPALPAAAANHDWPTYRHDNRRSGATTAKLTLPLEETWTHRAGQPRPAWSGPAKWDAFTANAGLQSMRNFDPCHHLTIAGGRVYFGSSADDAAHCLDAATGEPVWSFFTNAPVRLPPTISDGLAWFGSDDGHAYCLDAATGTLRWKRRPAPSPRLIASDGKLISPWPVRTGVLVDRGRAWFAASLLPWQPSYLCCLDAATGSMQGGFVAEHGELTLQGAMLAAGDLLFVPQGRSAPLTFNRSNGSRGDTIGQAGGVLCVLTEGNQLLAGPQNQKAPTSLVRLTDLTTGKTIATFNKTTRVTVAGTKAYLHSGNHLLALDLATTPPTTLWRSPQPAPEELIATGSHLVLGLHDRVILVDTHSGGQSATLTVDGTAHGLAAAAGQLLVSTDRGTIHAFGR
jgi:outer membrane protein assembly factor BamB